MMERIPALLLLLLIPVACGRVEPALPMPEAQLVAILVDVHLAEGAVHELPLSQRDSALQGLYDRIMVDHGVERADFDATMEVMRKEPELVNRIYTAVQDTLNVRSAATQVEGLR